MSRLFSERCSCIRATSATLVLIAQRRPHVGRKLVMQKSDNGANLVSMGTDVKDCNLLREGIKKNPFF